MTGRVSQLGDRAAALEACEEIFDNLFSQPVPREANGGFLVAPERTLGAAWNTIFLHSQC